MVRILLLIVALAHSGCAATTLYYYFGHEPSADSHGVIAPWYKGQNGQLDFRVRMAAETLKRYPWSTPGGAPPAPAYVFTGEWSIDYEGKISALPVNDWGDGDLGQRSAYIISGLIDYYRYSGDPAVFSPIRAIADYLIGYCQTGATQGWPGMLISVPTMGKPFGRCMLGPSEDLAKGEGKIQLDIVAEFGLALVRAYEMTGEASWYAAAKHWADLLAKNRNRDPAAPPWGRYADKGSSAGMNDIQTGGVAYILAFFDELIRTGYRGKDDEIVAARDAGRKYFRDVLLPAWTVDDTWGRNFWDWDNPVQCETVTDFAVNYMLDHPDYFPNWRTDARNILGLYLNHTSAGPASNAEVYNGAWAVPESSACCGRSLWYPTMELAAVFARYGAEADNEWAREIARRSQILATYDPLPDGQTMDLIDGGARVNLTWFKIAHPMALKHVLATMSWLPVVTGASRENHIMRSSAVVRRVSYGKGRIAYSTFDAPANTVEVLRLAFVPGAVTAGRRQLTRRTNLTAEGFTFEKLPGGDAIVSIRHDGATEVVVQGPDPQQVLEGKRLKLEGEWQASARGYTTSRTDASMTVRFIGNQVRLIAPVGPDGGYADVFVDDFKQLVPVDFYSPIAMNGQVLYYRNGLTSGPHTLRLVARGAHNPLAMGDSVRVGAVQFSDATGEVSFGEGGGPVNSQRMLFGYASRRDYVDSQGNAWRPGTEFVARTGDMTDTVAKTWWTMRQSVSIPGAADPELYRYGVHWRDLIINVTVGPGTYHARLKFAENEYTGPNQRGMTIYVNGKPMVDGLDVLATAGAPHKPVDIVFDGIQPKNGIIEIRLIGNPIRGVARDAIIQALEVGPGPGGPGAEPKTIAPGMR